MSTTSESVPVRVYINPDKNKELIVNENKGQAGIYRWVHIESGKSYIGSSNKLNTRFRQYFRAIQTSADRMYFVLNHVNNPLNISHKDNPKILYKENWAGSGLITGTCLWQKRSHNTIIKRYYSSPSESVSGGPCQSPRVSSNKSNPSFASNDLNKRPLINKMSVVKELSNEQFYQWLAGFTDAEGMFGIGHKGGNSFAFFYSIEMHIDEKPLLEYIQFRLGGIGTLYTNNNSCLLRMIAKNEIAIIIEIFTNVKLNTSKRDDFYTFIKAFSLYTTSNQKSLIREEILSLKNKMNKNRPYEISTYTDIVITDYWLLGFLMGDGSFWFTKVKSNILYPNFALVQTAREKPLLVPQKSNHF